VSEWVLRYFSIKGYSWLNKYEERDIDLHTTLYLKGARTLFLTENKNIYIAGKLSL
jgi:hypothetical protein